MLRGVPEKQKHVPHRDWRRKYHTEQGSHIMYESFEWRITKTAKTHILKFIFKK